VTYPPTPNDGTPIPPPPDPPIQAYQPPTQSYQSPTAPYHPSGQVHYQPPAATSYPAPYNPVQQSPYGQPSPYGPVQGLDLGYADSPYAYRGPHGQVRPTEGLAIASLAISVVAVLGVCAWGIGGLLGILGAIFGHVARRRIARTGANGSGMALAGIITGWVVSGLSLLFFGFIFFAIVSDPASSTF
jgi:hypothetical protein